MLQFSPFFAVLFQDVRLVTWLVCVEKDSGELVGTDQRGEQTTNGRRGISDSLSLSHTPSQRGDF